MATSPIYNWPEPDNTDLVKNGALAIRTLGNAIDTTMGTMVAKSIVDAKGDLIAASANDTPARIAVGANGETLVADSSTATGLAYKPLDAAGKNAIINGGMDIWQRGTSITGTSGIPHTADRWQVTRTGATGYTITRESSGSTLPEIQYCLRAQRDSGNTNTTLLGAFYSVESVNSIPFAGKATTMSFYVRSGANYSGGALTVEFSQGTGTDQNIISGGFTGKTNVGASSVTLTTSWQRVTITGTVATTTTQLGLQLYYTPSGTAGAADFFELTGVQVEVGSVATQFSRTGGTVQGELAACMRYYYRNTGPAGANTGFASGISEATTNAQVIMPLPVPMRVRPTTLDWSTVAITDTISYTTPATAVTIETGTASVIRLSVAVTGQTQYRPVQFMIQSNGYFGISAEL